VEDSAVDVIDYKTDRERDSEEEYRKQLSAYYHAGMEFSKIKKYPRRSSTPLRGRLER